MKMSETVVKIFKDVNGFSTISKPCRMHSMRQWFLVVLAFFLFTLLLICYSIPKRTLFKIYSHPNINQMDVEELTIVSDIHKNYSHGKWRMLSRSQKSQLSRLGRILFLDDESPTLNPPQKNYSILIWNHDRYLRARPHLIRSDPFKHCPVRNCAIEPNNSFFESADIVIFDIRTTKALWLWDISRKKNQIWAFLLDQSPLNILTSPNRTLNYSNLFNWSMTYRMNSDIPIPYGRTVSLGIGEKGVVQKYSQWNQNKKQDVLMAIVSSTCIGRNHRWKYIQKIQQYLKIDIYGKCGNNSCESNLINNCSEISQYKFYLAFEDCNCDEYITEKVWWHGYVQNAIPIVMGGAKGSYEQILPPYSYINIENFAHPRDLANYILYLNQTPSDLQDYFEWKKYFKVLNEHGRFQTDSIHYCRICEALNYNSKKRKTHGALDAFWNSNECHPSWDAF